MGELSDFLEAEGLGRPRSRPSRGGRTATAQKPKPMGLGEFLALDAAQEAANERAAARGLKAATAVSVLAPAPRQEPGPYRSTIPGADLRPGAAPPYVADLGGGVVGQVAPDAQGGEDLWFRRQLKMMGHPEWATLDAPSAQAYFDSQGGTLGPQALRPPAEHLADAQAANDNLAIAGQGLGASWDNSGPVKPVVETGLQALDYGLGAGSRAAGFAASGQPINWGASFYPAYQDQPVPGISQVLAELAPQDEAFVERWGPDVAAGLVSASGLSGEALTDPDVLGGFGLLGRAGKAGRGAAATERAAAVARARQATDAADRAGLAGQIVGDMQRRGGKPPSLLDLARERIAAEEVALPTAPEARVGTDAPTLDVSRQLPEAAPRAEPVPEAPPVRAAEPPRGSSLLELARERLAEEEAANASQAIASVDSAPANASASVATPPPAAVPDAPPARPAFAVGDDVTTAQGTSGRVEAVSADGRQIDVKMPDGRSFVSTPERLTVVPKATPATPAPRSAAAPKFSAGQWVDTADGPAQVVEVSPGRVVVERADGTEAEFTPDRLSLRQAPPEAPAAATPEPAPPAPRTAAAPPATGVNLPRVDEGRFPRGFSPMYVDDVGAVHGLVDDRGLFNYEVIHPSGNRELVLTGQRERSQAARAVHEYVDQGGDFVPWDQYRGEGRYAKNERGFWGKQGEALPSTGGTLPETLGARSAPLPRRGVPNPTPAPAPPRPPVARPATAAAPAPSPRKRGPVPEVKSPQQLARDLASILQTRIQYGRMAGVGSKAPGRFHVRRRLVEAAKSGDLSTIYHEAGHAIDVNRGLTQNLSSRSLADLERLADPAQTPGTMSSWKPGMPLRVKQAEGLAEFIRGWFEDQTGTRQANPAVAAEFEVWLDKQGRFGKDLRRAQNDYQKRINAPAQARIRASIIYNQAHGSWFTMNNLITSVYDMFHALQNLSEVLAETRGVKMLPPSQDPYVLARLTKSNAAVEYALGTRGLDGRIHGGIMDPNTFELKPGSKSLKEILESLEDNEAASLDFVDYLVARRADELHKRGLQSGFDPVEVQQVVQNLGTADFQRMAQEVYDWNDQVLQYAVDGGFLSKETANAFRALNQNYVPFHRFMEIGAGEQALLGGGGGLGKGLQSSDPGSFKRLRGSAREVINPIESMMQNAAAIMAATDKNRVALALAELWDSDAKNLGDFFREVKAPQQVTNLQAAEAVKAADLKRGLQNLGVDLTAAGVTDQSLRAMVQGLPDATVSRAKRQADMGTNTIRVKTPDGKVRFFELNPEVYRAYTSLNMEDVPSWVNWVGTMGQGLRLGATVLSAPFVIRNPIRDSFTAGVVSRVGTKPAVNLFQGMAAIFDEDLVREWELAGGGQSMEASLYNHEGYKKAVLDVASGLSAKALKNTWLPGALGAAFDRMRHVAGAPRRAVSAVRRSSPNLATGMAERFIASPIDLAAKVSEKTEMLSRLAEYKNAKERLRAENPTWSDADVRRRAAYESRDLMDFAMSGDGFVRFFRRIVPFFGAGLTGNYRLFRALRENPKATVARGLYTVGGMSMFLYGLNMAVNRKNYEQMPQRERDIFWHFPIGTGPEDFIRIPKPFLEGAIFGTGLERVAQFSYQKDPDAFHGYWAQLMEEMLPVNVLQPTKVPGELAGPAGKLMIELGTNFDYFRQRNIVPAWVRDDDRKDPKPAWMESDEFTTATSKALGKALGWSPMNIDHAIRSLTGTFGSDVVRGGPLFFGLAGPEVGLDQAVHALTGEELPKARPRKLMGFQYTESVSESEDRFWKLYKQVGEKVNGDRELGRPEDAEQVALYSEMESAGKTVRDLRKQLRQAEDEAQRRLLLDEIRRVTSEFTPAAGPNRLQQRK